MGRTITIDPLTRIEGHARITLQLDDAGQIAEARFAVLEFRGFESFCEGRPFTEMPAITARICGICPVSHGLAAARCGDGLLGLEPPAAAQRLRLLLNLAQICQSHALSFFHLSSPDWMLGWESDPARRNLFGLMAADPELARAGIRLRQFGQQIIERLAGRRIHAVAAVPGGVCSPLPPGAREAILAELPEARAIAAQALGGFKRLLDGPLAREALSFGNFDSLFLALVAADGRWSCLDGAISVIDSTGAVVSRDLDGNDYPQFLEERVEPDSLLKSPIYKPRGYPGGLYRVGPLARLNACQSMGTPWADAELVEFRQCHGSASSGGRIVTSSFAYHQARLLEIVACLERIEQVLADAELTSGAVRVHGQLTNHAAVGVAEAPRGTLFHHYRVDDNGLLTWVNLIIATGQNNLAMNRTIAQIAREWIAAPIAADIPEPLLNRVEAGIRCFDPCLSCSTHAAGAMPLHVVLRDAAGEVLAERWRP